MMNVGLVSVVLVVGFVFVLWKLENVVDWLMNMLFVRLIDSVMLLCIVVLCVVLMIVLLVL